MLKGRIIFFMLALLALLLVAGCGSGGNSDTNGTLSLTATGSDGPGETVIDGSATYNNTTTTGTFSGQEISVTLSAHTLGGDAVVRTFNLKADDTGTVYFHQPYTQISENLFVDVTAKTGGLSSPTVRIIVPPATAP